VVGGTVVVGATVVVTGTVVVGAAVVATVVASAVWLDDATGARITGAAALFAHAAATATTPAESRQIRATRGARTSLLVVVETGLAGSVL
jgi:hypothetical protein